MVHALAVTVNACIRIWSQLYLKRVTKLTLFLLIIIFQQNLLDIYDQLSNSFHLIYYLLCVKWIVVFRCTYLCTQPWWWVHTTCHFLVAGVKFQCCIIVSSNEIVKKQECIPVGCILPAYPIVSDEGERGGLPNPLLLDADPSLDAAPSECGTHLDADPLSMQIPLDVDPLDVDPPGRVCHLWTELEMLVKILPCPKLHLPVVIHWWIQGGARDAPRGSKFFLFHAVFGEKMKNNSTFGSWRTPPGKILDPPL